MLRFGAFHAAHFQAHAPFFRAIVSLPEPPHEDAENDVLRSDEDVEDDEELQMSEEAIAFLAASAARRKALREERHRLARLEGQQRKQTDAKKRRHAAEDKDKDERRLYGDAYDDVRKLERAVDDKFELLHKTLKPVLWPETPLCL